MGIEIRPAAVMAQIEAKRALLEGLLGELADKQAAISGFAQDDLLQGAGYEAAKERASSYAELLEAIGASAACTLQADAAVSAALSGYFGGCERVSEDEWLEKQREALAWAETMESMQAQARGGPGRSAESAKAVERAVRSARESAGFAGDMLSKIYSYCAETDGAYRDVDALNACIARGASAFAASGFGSEPGRWGELDASWTADLAPLASKASDPLYRRESREDPAAVCLSADMRSAYVAGERVDVEGAGGKELLDKINRALAEAGLHIVIDLAALGIEEDGAAKALDVLRAVGIEKGGKIRFTADGKAVFSGFTVREGSPRMATRASAANLSRLERPAAAVEAKGIEASSKALGKGVRAAGTAVTGVFTAADAANAYNEAYERGEGKPEDRRRSDAEAAVVGSLIKSGTGIGAGAAVGFICGVIGFGPAGMAGGAVAGSLLGAALEGKVEEALKADYDGDGLTTQDDIDEWWYREGGHAIVDKIYHGKSEGNQTRHLRWSAGTANP